MGSSKVVQIKTEFDCRLCGHCCEGRGGIIVSNSDLERLCNFLQLQTSEFEELWAVKHNGKLYIRSTVSGCVFFQKGTGCLVHSAKPNICRAWPYFRGNLVDSESLALAKDFCPGIPVTQSHDAFVMEGISYLQRENLLGSATPDEAGALQVSDLLEKLAYNTGKG